MIEVHDDRRILRFEGEELAFSSSERPGSDRWIEFTLYRTAGDGQYVLSRVGVSNVYHTPECRFAADGRIQPVPASELDEDARPCPECRPEATGFPLFCPETDKTWARNYRTVDALMSGLMKHDANGGLYMTAVARRLLEAAARVDPAIVGARRVETLT